MLVLNSIVIDCRWIDILVGHMYYYVDENNGWYGIDNMQEMSWYVGEVWMLNSIDWSCKVRCVLDEWLILRVGCYHIWMPLVHTLIYRSH